MFSPIELPLLCHPATPCAAVDAITVAVAPLGDGSLALRYRVCCQPGQVRLPAPQPGGPADGLWQHSCGEAFIADGDGPEYREFNFSPSGQWAAYRFTGYRERDSGFAPPAEPRITLQRLPDGFRIDAELGPALLPAGDAWQLGLTMVIEAADGSKSYWALQHGAAHPDFHLRQGFALTLNRQLP